MIYAFEDFELDDELFELRRNGEAVAVQPKVLDLLFLLVRIRDRVVTKKEVFDAIWPGVAVSETSLARTVLGARRALGDDGEEPRVIATVRGRGLRFLLPVSERAARVTAPPSAVDASRLDAAIAGQGSLVLIAGGAGMGKTRMLRDLVSAARARKMATASVFASPDAPDLWIFSEASRALGIPYEEKPTRFARFEALVRRISEKARTVPVFIAIDDVHLADVESLAFLELVARSLPDLPAVIAVAFREEGPRLASIAALKSAWGAHAMPLRPLDAQAVAAMVLEHTGYIATPELATKLQSKSGGNPLLVRQLLETEWARSALLHPSAVVTSSVDMRPSLLESTVRLLDTVSDACRDTLATAAVMGKVFEIAPLARAASMDPARLLELLEEAMRARVLTREGPHTYGFAYTILRDALYKRLSEPERARRHGAVGDALADHYRGREDDHAAELAGHFMRAAPLGVSFADRACHFSMRAARRADRSTSRRWRRSRSCPTTRDARRSSRL
jgi:DNA-binding winged helix-turn-helix (wHTH) protein